MNNKELLNEQLIKAILDKNYKKVHYILALKADVNARAFMGNGRSCLSIAKKIGALEIANLLEERGGVEINPSSEEAKNLGVGVFYCLTEDEVKNHFLMGADFNVRDNNGDTPLLVTLKYKQFSHAWWYIKYMNNVNAINNEGKNALFYAVSKPDEEMFNDFWEELLKKGADVFQVDYNGNSVLFYAIESRKYDRAKDLIKRGLNVNRASKEGISALDIACFMGDAEGVDLLIKNGADVNKKDRKKITPLIYAVRNEKVTNEIVRMLLEAGANMDEKDCFGERAIDVAINWQRWDIVCSLIEYGAKVDEKNKEMIEKVSDKNVVEMIKDALDKRKERMKVKNKMIKKTITVSDFFKKIFERK